jgi:hypothetical protein
MGQAESQLRKFVVPFVFAYGRCLCLGSMLDLVESSS